MAKTRTQIKTAVHLNTGRGTEKAAVIETACDEALKIAQDNHNFEAGLAYDQDTVIVEDAITVDISTITNIIDVVSATIIETDGDLNKPFFLQNETWWNLNVVNAADNQKGWPENGIRRGTTIYLDRPADDNLTLRLVVSQTQSFTSDSTTNPIPVLDTFIIQYATAAVFSSIEAFDKAAYWNTQALGPDYLRDNRVGGSLLAAINKDKRDAAQFFKASRYPNVVDSSAVAIRNLIDGHPNYGNVATWHNH